MFQKFILLIVWILFYNSLKAQVEKIDTDRPDQTESAFTVPARWIQVETGFTREKISAKTVSWTLPTILSKYGLSKKWELRLLTEYNAQSFSYANYRLTDTFGLLPITVGFKVNLIEEKNLLPRISLIGYTGLNRLSSRKTNAHFGSFFSPGIRLLFKIHYLKMRLSGTTSVWSGKTHRNLLPGFIRLHPDLTLEKNGMAISKLLDFCVKTKPRNIALMPVLPIISLII